MNQPDFFIPAKEDSMAPTPKQDEGSLQLPRVSIDMKLPMWGLVTAAVIALSCLIAMYYRLDQVGRDVNEMQLALKATNATTIQFAQDLAVMKFRMDKLEQGHTK
jgi:hypothetical protein